MSKIFKSLSSDEKVFIFPEGTTSDGNRVLDFKSSSFSALEGKNLIIQPIVIFKLKKNKKISEKKYLNDALLTSIAGISAAMKNTG